MANLTYRQATQEAPAGTTTKNAMLTSQEIDGNFKSLDTAKLELSDTVSTNTPNTPVRRDSNGDFAARIITVVDLNSTSDQTLKVDIQPITGMELLRQIRPVAFKWKDTGSQSYGVIAQEIEQILPELVAEQENGIKNVSYIPIIALLIDAVKTLDRRVQELQNDL